MSGEKITERTFAGINQLSLRSLILGIIGSGIITASSMYVALRISALPWPTIFVAVLSMALLKVLGKTTLNEINITQTAMSAGAMVAGGLAFTLPGLWITNVWAGPGMFNQHFLKVLGIALVGMLLGTALTWFLRQKFIEKEALPYPIGAAAAETIAVGDTGGKKAWVLFGAMGLSGVYTLLRDGFSVIPSAFMSKWLYAKNFFVGIWVSPMATGIGFLIGTLYTGIWFLGAILSYLIIIPFGTALHLFPSVAAAQSFKNTAGIGLMVGTGIGIFLAFIFNLIRKFLMKNNDSNNININILKRLTLPGRIWTALAFLSAFVLSVICGLDPIQSILLMLGVLAASAMAATITGETGINPMEIFGIIIFLAVRLIVDVDTIGAFFIAAAVAVACGYAGDLLNDYKAGHVLGTNPLAQLISQVAGGVAGTVIAALAMFAIISQYGGVGIDKGLPAGQAFAVSQMVSGIGNPLVFGIASLIGALLYLFKVPSMTLGIGLYLPFEISAAMFVGGILRYITDKTHPQSLEAGNIAASGMLGGEGIAGVSIAILKMITGS